MKLTNCILDLGRVVAYYPGLKRVTGSTTGTIFLSQLLYWTPKAKDGWIHKKSIELEEETGLTYNEQRTARKALLEVSLIFEKHLRLDHEVAFKVNQERLNDLWESKSPSENNNTPEVVVPVPDPEPVPEVKLETPELPAHKTAVVKKGDLVDGMLAFANSSGMKRLKLETEIQEKFEKRLKVNAGNKKWSALIKHAATRQEHHGESVDKFIEWAMREGFNPVYWTPEKMITMYPQAFPGEAQAEQGDGFVKPAPEVKQKEFSPMPKDLGKRPESY